MRDSFNKRDARSVFSPKVARNLDIAREETNRMIYCLVIIGGIEITYQDFVKIINYGIVKGELSPDLQKIKNIECAWKYIISQETLNCPTSLSILFQIVKILNEGFYVRNERIRSEPLSIEGTTYVSPAPRKEDIKWEIHSIVSKWNKPAEVAIDLCFYCIKTHIFNRWNKQAALLLANHFLISKGGGLIMVDKNDLQEFNHLLVSYYEGVDETEIKQIMKNKYLNCFDLDTVDESDNIIEKVKQKFKNACGQTNPPYFNKTEKQIAEEKAELIWLLSLNYSNVVSYLLIKYGPATGNYFLDENCIIRNRSITRTGEGLFCHHIDEDKAIYLSSSSSASRNPFEFQHKEHLVYCNLLEHLILHVKIVEGARHPNANKKELLGIVGAEFICSDLNDIYGERGIVDKWPAIVGDVVIDHFDVYIKILKYLLAVIEKKPEYHNSTNIKNLSMDGANTIVPRVWESLKSNESIN